MDTRNLLDKFSRIGARLKVAEVSARRHGLASLSIDIQHDQKGEYFEFGHGSETVPSVDVLDVQPADRHLLLLIREGDEKRKFLCGHDERHWFVAAIPENSPVGNVDQAKEALKPDAVKIAQRQGRLPTRDRNRRKNAVFLRQGEWFFLPMPNLVVDDRLILRNEPIRRGNGGKPHFVDLCCRSGGETVYVCTRHPNGLAEKEYRELLGANPNARTWAWRVMRRNAGVYVRGRVRHADHKTIVLKGWHQVLMNTENLAKAMVNVAFLD